MKKDISVMCDSVSVDAYTGDSVTVNVVGVDLDDLLNSVPESAIMEYLITNVGLEQLKEWLK